MTGNQPEALKRLRKIILQDGEVRLSELEQALKNLRARIEDTDELLEKLDPVIADMLARKILESKDDMAEALAPVMGAAIKTQIADAKDDMVDALYPIIGSTIRKSIAEAMKNLVKTVNEKVDRALSFQLLFRKIKSRMTGVSEGELLLKEAMPFEIHQIFLIHKETGLLLSQVSGQRSSPSANQDIISGMLTAIRDFANTAFSGNGRHELSKLQYDDLDIHIEVGRHAYLAVVTSGVPPDGFAQGLRVTEQKIHNLFYKQLRTFDGNTSAFDDCPRTLRKNLLSLSPDAAAVASPAKKKTTKRMVFFILLVVAAAVVTFQLKPEWFTFRTEVVEPRFDTIAALSRIRNGLSSQFDFASDTFAFVWDGDILMVNGEVPTEEDKILLGKAIAALSPGRMLVNNLKFARPLTTVPVVVQEQIEATVVYFAGNSSRISRSEAVRLAAIIPLIRAYPVHRVTIHGHSDTQGDEEANRRISLKRAQRVRDALVAAGVDSTRIDLFAWGTQKPLASNETAAGRARNRRVELALAPQK